MTLGAFAFVCALALASTPGHALLFAFSFTNDPSLGDTQGTVTGTFDLFMDPVDPTVWRAFDTRIDSAIPAIFGLGDVAFPNLFTVTNGTITSALYNLDSVGDLRTTLSICFGVTDCSGFDLPHEFGKA
jgi:hypothetical protein